MTRFNSLRPACPPCVSDRTLRRRIARGLSDAACCRPAQTRSELNRLAGLKRKQQMQARGEKIHVYPRTYREDSPT